MRRVAVAAALVGVCLAGGADADGAPARGHWRVTALPSATTPASSFSEPGVATGADGTVVVNACTANSGVPATLWSSPDRGRTWSRGFTVADSAIGCGDSDVAIGSDGYQYTLVLGAGVEVYRSRDGERWQGPAGFPPPHGEDQPDRPWLVTVPQQPATVYLFNSEIGGNIVAWVSHDRARTFSGPVPVTGGLNSQAALTLGSRPLVDPRHPRRMFEYYETATLAGLTSSAGESGPSQFPLSQLWEAVSTDAGQHWDNRLVLDVAAAFPAGSGTLGHLLPATSIDHDGTRYVVLSVQLGDDPATHLYLIHSGRHGWSAPARIGESTASNVMPAIAVGRPGHLVVSWYASSAHDFNDPAARWVEMVATTAEALAAEPRFAMTRLSGAHPVHVGAVDNMGAVGNDLGQNWALRDFQDVELDRCGRPHVTWADDSGPTPRTYVATTTGPCRISSLGSAVQGEQLGAGT